MMARMQRAACGNVPFAWMAAILGIARLAAMSPEPPDAHTLHLWSLDEDGPPFHDRGTSPKPLLGLLNGALAGQASLPGFGKAVSFDHHVGGDPQTLTLRGALLLAQPQSVNGPEDNVSAPFPIMGKDGAFTIEALVKFNRLPAEAPGIALDVVSMDGEATDRVFCLRVEKPGFLNFTTFDDGAVRGGALATIPVSGPHAINTDDWFHLAAAYTGDEGVPGNLILYWTRIAPGLAAANVIGRGSLSADLTKVLGDFAIGNTGRTIASNHECNPFPGLIDEVRISDIAREPEDFFFVPAEAKAMAAGKKREPAVSDDPLRLDLQQVLVNGQPVALPAAHAPLVIEPGLHRLDIDFGLQRRTLRLPVKVRYQMQGIDDGWHPAISGMSVICELLGAAGEIVAHSAFSKSGQSAQWSGDVIFTPMELRQEPLFLPENAKFLKITLSSGTPDTTGQMLVQNIMLHLPGAKGHAESQWKNGNFQKGVRLYTHGGEPDGWKRGGDDRAIAPLIQRKTEKALGKTERALGLLDGREDAAGSWSCTQELPKIPAGGVTALLSWRQAHNVMSGGVQRATYLNVPSGRFHFHALAATAEPQTVGTQLKLPINVRQSFWESPWFRPVAASAAIGLIGLVFLQTYRRRSHARISKLRMQHTLERDRARIARDLHDDLGTRVSGLLIGASLVKRDLQRDPAAADRHLARVSASAHDLVTAMDEMVWSVDPANDTLDQLASRLAGMVQEMFRDSGGKAKIALPDLPPAMPLHPELRHHVSLAVKESLNNVLKHAGPCEVSFELAIDGGSLHVIIRDTGCGFDSTALPEGNGLFNLHSRLAELGGTCEIDSVVGEGTRVTLVCPFEKPHHRSHPK